MSDRTFEIVHLPPIDTDDHDWASDGTFPGDVFRTDLLVSHPVADNYDSNGTTQPTPFLFPSITDREPGYFSHARDTSREFEVIESNWRVYRNTLVCMFLRGTSMN